MDDYDLQENDVDMRKNILIVGANFENKGAQSMLFVTVDELKKRNPKCEVYFASYEIIDDNKYTFRQIYYSEYAKSIALNEKNNVLIIRCFLKDCIKYIIGKRNNLFRYNEVKNNIGKMDLIIDVSGFNLGKKWNIEIQEAYLNNIRIAKKYNIPMILMPQSFGPFDYSINKSFLLLDIKDLLRYPTIIFAREKEGYDALIKEFGLNNVQMSTDIVLQNSSVNKSNIYKKPLKRESFPDVKDGAVAVIPNVRCFEHGDKDIIVRMYRSIISYLIDKGIIVYIFRHSSEDLPVCKLIAKQFHSMDVILLENDFSCLEYNEFIKKFEFVICSRFHGIVHAYKNYVPTILLGWAIKYKELARNVGQEQFAFDITGDQIKIGEIIKAIEYLIENCKEASIVIKEHIGVIREKNCFDIISGWLV